MAMPVHLPVICRNRTLSAVAKLSSMARVVGFKANLIAVRYSYITYEQPETIY